MAADRQSHSTRTLSTGSRPVEMYSLPHLATEVGTDISRMPMTVKILLENVLRLAAGGDARDSDVERLARWSGSSDARGEFPFLPARVLLQDFTGVPAVVDLAAMRSAISRLNGDAQRINPSSPADLVIDHSVMVDAFGTTLAFAHNVE
ncbi:MAG: aconitase family protein, partial [Chloroflexota bacterium]